jgi:subtilisin family serine protease
MKFTAILVAALFSGSLMAKDLGNDMLVQVSPTSKDKTVSELQARLPQGSIVEDLGINGWVHVKLPQDMATVFNMNTILNRPGILKAHKNFKLGLLENFKVRDARIRAEIVRRYNAGTLGMFDPPPADNPEFPTSGSGGSGADPLFSKQWGMNQMGVQSGWSVTKGAPSVIVGVIDTGIDYTHEDLVDNMWHNPGEIPGNGIDDDKNGYIDDVVGWDFAANDNKPFDLPADMMSMLMSGGNPGHGTHCAGNVAARGDNGKGIAGVAPNVKLMALRFISEKGQGDTAGAVKAIKYGVDMGAKVLSNSWGSVGDDGGEESKALQDAIQYAQDHGVIFVAAAGNGDQMGKGYDNDVTANKPAYPSSYPHDIIISVAAVAEDGNLGTFSNWGATTVDLAAPGVKVFSTVVQSEHYSDTVIDIPGLMTATWDGTSMATPHVAGAAALYISGNPGKDWRQVKAAILNSVKKTSVLQGKMTSGGQLDVANMMRN